MYFFWSNVNNMAPYFSLIDVSPFVRETIPAIRSFSFLSIDTLKQELYMPH